jgi:GT2 family glycosyltransferase
MSEKIVNSNCPEFGYELLSAVPYAYNLYLKGELKETISGFDTSCIYFFSPKHTETNCKRSWDNMDKLWRTKFPNINIHRPQLDWDLFSSPPFKEHYKNKSIIFEKETIVIFNRYNNEWGGPPINYLDLETLDKLFNMLSEEYQVVYINLNKSDKYFDGANPLILNDDKIVKKYPKVLSLYDLIDSYPTLSINEIQLRIFANCSKYISSNGGQLILSAYFGGENIIFSKKCRELTPNVNSFYKWYHKLGGGVFQHVNNYDDLIQLVNEKWVLKKPLINILIRTSNRPNYFNGCVNSIYSQKYKNWNIIIGVDNLNSLSYTQPDKGRDVFYNYDNVIIPKPPNGVEYGIPFKYNSYINDLQDEVKDGYIVIIDDDDKLYDEYSLQKLADAIKTNDDLVFWRVKFPNRLVPSDDNFGVEPVLRDISGIGFSFHVKNKEIWEPYKRGDYRVSKKLYKKIENKIFLNEILTELQRDVEDGMGRRDDKFINKIQDDNLKYKITIIVPTFNTVEYFEECLDSIIKSIKNLDCEILVGIDDCGKTKSFVEGKTFDHRFRFFYFYKNVGPYIIKNSLSKVSKSNYLLFFDSDDIMTETLIQDCLNLKENYKLIKPMYLNFNNNVKNIDYSINKTKTYGEGVFAIDKKTFLNFNGFIGWRCAADSELMTRLYSNKIKMLATKNIGFYRRIHPNSLTQNPETGLASKFRHNYINSKKEVLKSLETESFYEISVKHIIKNNNDEFVLQKKSQDIVNDTLIKIGDIPINPNKERKFKDTVKYDLVNQIINNKKIYAPTEQNNKPVVQHKPKNKQETIDFNKNSLVTQNKMLKSIRPNRNNLTPNVFGGKKRI